MMRAAAMWLVISLGLTGWIYLQDDVPPRQLPIWFGCCLALGGLIYLGIRYQAAHPRSSGATVSVVADDGGRLVIARAGKPPSVRRLDDGGVIAEAAVPAVPATPGDELELRSDTVLYGDLARLYFTGEQRRTLHGLQPQPATPLEFIRGELVTTRALLATPPSPLPILVLHRAALDDDEGELLTLVSLDGHARWQLRFDRWTVRRARELHVAPDHLVLVLGPTDSDHGWDGRTTRRRGREKPEVLVLAMATGAVCWRELL